MPQPQVNDTTLVKEKEKGAYCSPLEEERNRVAFPTLCPTSFTLRLPGTLQLVRPPDLHRLAWWN